MKSFNRNWILICAIILFSLYKVSAQQIPDTAYIPTIENIAYPNQDGPVVHIDHAHNNFHTKDGRYYTFARLLELDGYTVASNTQRFEDYLPDSIQILVIANAEADGVTDPIVTPTASAFSEAEIINIHEWVSAGGSLFLIADHMPFAGAAAKLASAFGFHFYDSYVMYHPKNGIIDFKRKHNNLADNILTNGSSASQRIKHIRTFTGQGFKIPAAAESILRLDETQTVYLTDTMWVFNNKVETFSAKGLSQGAYMTYGKGKIVVFGEAARFSAQLAGPNRRKVGMNSQEAQENYKLALNIIHWLDGRL